MRKIEKKQPPTREELLERGLLKPMREKSYHEGKAARERSGRKLREVPVHLLPDDHIRRRKRYSITLSRGAHRLAKKIGEGNVSGGIERAINHFFDCPRTDRRKKDYV